MDHSSLEQIWQAILSEAELNMSKASFTTWFKNSFIFDYQDDILTIGVPNAFTQAWFENKFSKDITKTFYKVTGNKLKGIKYIIKTKPKEAKSNFLAPDPPEEKENKAYKTNPSKDESLCLAAGLNPKYTFETFIVGKHNELAHAASWAAIRQPGETYNPLFIYGGVGLGKTHLLQAIGHEVLKSGKKVLYVTSEKFTNDYVDAVYHGQGNTFKSVYRNVDLLLVDDIQFMAGKDGTQQEFFYTFDQLHRANKQIVITSDRSPRNMKAVEARLITRFEWGMVADIGQPDLETRMAILNSKCQQKNFPLDQSIIQYIATNISNNIRELEGALNRIIGFCQFHNCEPDLSIAKQVLKDFFISIQANNLSTPQKILEAVANFYNLNLSELTGSSRKKELVIPRQIAMYLLRTRMDASFPFIGQELGGRDHTTAMHACAKIERDIQNNSKIRQDIEQISQSITSVY
ncbi:chromosomal replication initiator protein DnaA [Patescibacteria group bacterium]|jgi:chromosomal replication initiator protein|nr:chromosomal replication initiator protein DnaA [Patescibacteria group bacterium]HPD07868.1 chromosomal replication initiator protein DnaA [bacterium]HRT11138.1 chromosomal replication initiator protein DnaA [Patescibacteria group bacterium]HRU89977.1 chromosomal replication initiator protein DnaA [Patescibacteria group bacterium]